MPGKLTFRTKILQGGKTATGIQVPEAIVEQIGAGKRPPVKATINGYTYRSTVAVMGGKFMIGVSADVREQAKVAGGDMVSVALELDNAPREVTVPADFKKVLDQDAAARKRFDALSYSKKQVLVMPIERGKTVETRDRNIAKAIASLRAAK